MSYDPELPEHLGNGGFGIATRDHEGRWVNTIDMNTGGAKTFVLGPWKPSYGLATYGVDPRTKTAWAVINHNGEFAVANGIEPVPGHRKSSGGPRLPAPRSRLSTPAASDRWRDRKPGSGAWRYFGHFLRPAFGPGLSTTAVAHRNAATASFALTDFG
jgi:hypothetical protein